MTRAEWIEVSVIAVLAPASWLAWPYFAPTMPLWQLALSLSALLLAHSLVRDTAILLRSRMSESTGHRREAHCFCLESTIGATGVVVGVVLAALVLSIQVAIALVFRVRRSGNHGVRVCGQGPGHFLESARAAAREGPLESHRPLEQQIAVVLDAAAASARSPTRLRNVKTGSLQPPD